MFGFVFPPPDFVTSESDDVLAHVMEEAEAQRSCEAGRSTINATDSAPRLIVRSRRRRDDRSALEAHSSCSRGAEPVPGP